MLSSNTSAANSAANYIEDVFSTWLYTGNGSTQTITNGIDLAGKGGLVWTKARSAANRHALVDTVRGGSWELASNLTDGNNAISPATTFGAIGYTMNDSATSFNQNGTTYASWTFRKQPKFFDVVTYTGDGNTGAGQTIAHSLGSAPGAIFIKATSTTGSWLVYHRSTPSAGGAGPGAIFLNTTAAASTTLSAIGFANATTFNVGVNTATIAANTNGVTYVAYLFAHNAGGFGLTGTDNVISCGSYTGNGSTTGPTVTLGYEPQWVLIKDASNASPDWWMFDNMRGVATGGVDMGLRPNTSGAEVTANDYLSFTATGFQPTNTTNTVNQSGDTYIYIAIRRGPMKVPTDGTKVFSPVFASSSGAFTATAGFPVDLDFYGDKSNTDKWFWFDRLRGNPFLQSNTTGAESASTGKFDSNTAFSLTATGNFSNFINYALRRAPGFFDEVCYTGDATGNRKINHNLTVAPELLIVKKRSSATFGSWRSYAAPLGATQAIDLNSNAAAITYSIWNDTAPTTTQFTVQTNYANSSGDTFVAYLFASCPGVSKVGSYTGTGTTLQVNCGFTAGARFVLIKRTDSTGDWYVWDSARGIVAGNDPYLLLNSTAAEVTTTDYVDTYSAGFEISSTAPAAINASGGTFIFLAIA